MTSGHGGGEPGARPVQKALALIVARELAANLATPVFLIDAGGTMVFYNDAAEEVVGRPFSEIGEVGALAWGQMLDLRRADGEPIRRRHTPSGVAFFERRPCHDTLQATALDGSARLVEVTAFPLMATKDEFQGVVTIFWEAER